ncbi:MAG: hypothetical protein ACLQB1_19020, partial [Streptosporangiaceae bacterium]
EVTPSVTCIPATYWCRRLSVDCFQDGLRESQISSDALSSGEPEPGRRRAAATMFAHHVFVADDGKVSFNPAQRRTAGPLAPVRGQCGGTPHTTDRGSRSPPPTGSFIQFWPVRPDTGQ